MNAALYREEEKEVYGNEASEERRTFLRNLVDVVYKFSRDESSKGYSKSMTWKRIAERMFGPWSAHTGEEVEDIWRKLRDKFDEEVRKEESSTPRTKRKRPNWFLYEKLSFLKEHSGKMATSGFVQGGQSARTRTFSQPSSPLLSPMPSPSPSLSPSLSPTSSLSPSPSPKRGRRYVASEMERSYVDPFFEPIGDPDYESDDPHSDDASDDQDSNTSLDTKTLSCFTEIANKLNSVLEKTLQTAPLTQQPQPSQVALSSDIKIFTAALETALSMVPAEMHLQCFTEMMQVACKYQKKSTSSN